MKLAFIFLFFGVLLLMLLSYSLGLEFQKKGVAIHVRDTYYILSYSFIIIFSILLLGTFFSIGGILNYGLKKNWFLVLFSLLVFADSYFTYHSFKMFKKINDVSKEFEKKGFKTGIKQSTSSQQKH